MGLAGGARLTTAYDAVGGGIYYVDATQGSDSASAHPRKVQQVLMGHTEGMGLRDEKNALVWNDDARDGVHRG